jgi:hypothetical protein
MMDAYLIWSNEHRGWWKRKGYGYCTGLRGAGQFTREQALKICQNALPTAAHIGEISEIPVRLADIEAIIKDRIVPQSVTEGARPWTNDYS